jgi:hypothetical protein
MNSSRSSCAWRVPALALLAWLAAGVLLSRLPLPRRRWVDYAVSYVIGADAMFWVIERVGAFA